MHNFNVGNILIDILTIFPNKTLTGRLSCDRFEEFYWSITNSREFTIIYKTKICQNYKLQLTLFDLSNIEDLLRKRLS